MRRSGFATMTGVILVLLVAGAIAAVSVWFTWDVRRTHREAADAQLRQFLLAGAAAAPAHLAPVATAPPAPVTLALPDALTRQGARVLLHLEPAPEGERRAVVEAHLGIHHARQRLRFELASGVWRLVEAQLQR